MTQYPKISIVTPSLNQGVFIEHTITSVLDQAYPNLEYIIIDGKSTDDSVKIIKRYAKHLTHWESSNDRSQADALNKGFARSTGPIMTWINSDDILMPGALHLVAAIFTQCKTISWITGTPAMIAPSGHITSIGRPPVYIQSLIARGLYHDGLLNFIMQEGTFWKRSLWKKSGSHVPEKDYSLDFALWRRFARHAPLIPVRTLLAAYRLNPNRKNTTMDAYMRELGFAHYQHMRWLTYPLRMLVHRGLKKTAAHQEITYQSDAWAYRHGAHTLQTVRVSPYTTS